MSDDVWKRSEIESPCIKICVVHPEARICTGCLRSIDEITQWSRMTPEERREIMADLPNRKPFPTTRRGGRKGRSPSDNARVLSDELSGFRLTVRMVLFAEHVG